MKVCLLPKLNFWNKRFAHTISSKMTDPKATLYFKVKRTTQQFWFLKQGQSVLKLQIAAFWDIYSISPPINIFCTYTNQIFFYELCKSIYLYIPLAHLYVYIYIYIYIYTHILPLNLLTKFSSGVLCMKKP